MVYFSGPRSKVLVSALVDRSVDVAEDLVN